MTDIYSIFDASGKIIRKVKAADPTIAGWQVETGEFILNDDLDPETQYIVGPGTTDTVTFRPLLSTVVSWNKTAITADGSDSAVLSSIPNPSIVSILVPDGVDPVADLTVVDGILTVTSDAPVDYLVRVASFPYQLYEQKITAS